MNFHSKILKFESYLFSMKFQNLSFSLVNLVTLFFMNFSRFFPNPWSTNLWRTNKSLLKPYQRKLFVLSSGHLETMAHHLFNCIRQKVLKNPAFFSIKKRFESNILRLYFFFFINWLVGFNYFKNPKVFFNFTSR